MCSGRDEGFKAGLDGAAAALDVASLSAAYAAGEQGRQFGWQAGWTTFYWAWWIAFSPFVGFFLGADIARPHGARIYLGLRICAGDGMFCVYDHSWGYGH